MIAFSGRNRDHRTSRLFGPIVAIGLGSLLLLVVASAFLIKRFDESALVRERYMVEHGLGQQFSEFEAVVVPQVTWDDAVSALDHEVDQDWADFNIGDYLYTFNGFSRSFVIDGKERPVYAAIDGKRADPGLYRPFATVFAPLVAEVRKAEAARPPLRPHPGNTTPITRPIQSHGIVRIEGKAFIVIATLVQPDFGVYLPKGPRAPVTITARPMDSAMLGSFAKRYLLDDLALERPGSQPPGKATIALKAPTGDPIGVLSWRPRQPGTMLLNQLKIPLLIALVLFCLLAWQVVRRGTRVAGDLIASEAKAQHLAFHDPLTGLANRSRLFEQLGLKLSGIGKHSKGVAILCVDLDRFKEVNDTLGHHAGDLLIRETAWRLSCQSGNDALISRLGGDEFVVLVDLNDPAQVETLAQRILEAIRQPLDTEYGRLEVGCSIGYVIIDTPGIDPSTALRQADLALYRSKELGRLRATGFDPEMDIQLRNRQALEADLRKALSDGGLRMVYQPQVDRSGRTTGVEALLRWSHPVNGQVPPDVFVPLAEECGLILPLGEFVLRRVFAETAAWQGLRVAINISAVQMRSPGFAALVTRLAAQHGVDPARYELELTETALLGDDPATAANVEALSRLGFTFALDDFGTGYSSLSVLQRFAVNKIKIDRTFVSSLGGNRDAEALVDAMVKLARALNLDVIAEGVETPLQMDRLIVCGCHEFQGHLVGMPVPPTAIVAAIDVGLGEVPFEELSVPVAEPRRAVRR